MSNAILVLGCPGSGKTTLGRALAADMTWSRFNPTSGAPLLVVDTGRVEAFDDMDHAETLDEALEAVWGEGVDVAYTPKDPEDFDRLCGAVYSARGVVLFVDELFNVVPSIRSMSTNFQRCMRERRRVLHGCVVTSQLYRDGGRVLKGLVTEVRVFRMPAPEDQADLRADYGLAPEVVAALPSAKELAASGGDPAKAHLVVKVGF